MITNTTARTSTRNSERLRVIREIVREYRKNMQAARYMAVAEVLIVLVMIGALFMHTSVAAMCTQYF